jgi:hypothetical protein
LHHKTRFWLLQDHQSNVQLLPSPLFGNVDLLMDLLCVSEADSTVKAYYAGFMRWKKLFISGVMGSLFSIGVTNQRFAP